ncbi:DEAD/DEAH box helicase [Actinocorallia aurea]
MPGNLDPLATSALVIATYRRYLRSLLPVRDPRIAEALDEQIRTSPLLTKGPFLEATPPYETGSALSALIDEGILDPAFATLGGPELPLDRPLYRHQEEALRKAITYRRNVVVATGTGSGKTESFLFPILNELARQHRERRLGPGVRALLLYPMNALANDQMKRLRKLLAGTPHITFGRYTGDTREHDTEARAEFELLNPGEPLLPNELLSRAEMRANPPHILLTNYAMLEYLLLRPADMELFEGTHGGNWRFIAVDEAHVYDGARAAELAMLLRRLRDRVSADRGLQCLATSATVGDDAAAVTRFASGLFDAPFAWDERDKTHRDLVRATYRVDPPAPTWGPLSDTDYRALAAAAQPAEQIAKLAASYGVAPGDAAGLLRAEQRMAELRRSLGEGPRPIKEAAAEVFADAADPARALADLVETGSRLFDAAGSPVLSARYHLFARATEGAYTCLSESGPHVSLGRHEKCGQCAAAAFEFGSCQRCGTVHLSGTIDTAEGRERFAPRRHGQPQVWLRLGEGQKVVDEDDLAFHDSVSNIDTVEALLCTACGTLNPMVAACLACTGGHFHPVQRLTRARNSPPCLACGLNTPNGIRRFESGENAAPAVVTTALYQSIPPASDPVVTAPGEGRKLLMFSDSRQSAAFFAPYLGQSYGTVQRRRLIWLGLQQATAQDPDFGLDDLIFHVAEVAKRNRVFVRETRQQRVRFAGLWVAQELFPTDDRQSLEGRGLLRIRMRRDELWPTPEPLLRLGLGEEEVWDLLNELVASIRAQGAISMPEGVAADDEAFEFRKGPIHVRSGGSEAARKVISWTPTRGTNRRLDYLTRVLHSLDAAADPAALLRDCWRFLASLDDGWFVPIHDRRLGALHQIDHRWLVPSAEGALFQCASCLRLTSASVRGVCPTLRCEGFLKPYTLPAEALDDDHYRAQYRSLDPVPLRVEEHTAQWTGQQAGKIQQDFVRGHVNALSCSTTFELGVDVGELQAVLLRNMPPNTSSYVQRAGRAGRRASAAALVITYAQRRSHDLSRFQEPEQMISGRIRAPYVPLENERIDRRHAHSVAIAAFFRHHMLCGGRTWRTAGDFFLGDNPASNEVRDFLTPMPEGVRASLRRILPHPVQRDLDIEGGAWAEQLWGHLEDVQANFADEVGAFEERMRQAKDADDFRLADRYKQTLNTLRGRSLIGFLANRNVLPKYGFPVDTVELRTSHTDSDVGHHLELSRDLSAAIHEYAPGSEIVAGGVLWTSAGVHRLPNKELVSKRFVVCRECNYFQHGLDELKTVCPACGIKYSAANKPRTYVVPEFGFVAAKKTGRPSTQPPERSWNGATYVLSPPPEGRELLWRLANGGTVTANAGARGELIAISNGRTGSGHMICERCGWGAPPNSRQTKGRHLSPLRGTECGGPLKPRTLAHRYETDILELAFDARALPAADDGILLSLTSALLEGAANELQISADDINGTLHPKPGGRRAVVIYDTVPGGAGNAMRVAEHLDAVLAGAFAKVSSCDCGEETSCYGCLRTFRNQWNHELLVRGAVKNALAPLVPAVSQEVGEMPAGGQAVVTRA